MGWKKKNFRPKLDTRIGVELGEGKHRFIKDDIARDIDASCGNVKALEAFVERAIAKKGTLLRPESKFVGIIGPEIGSASTTEDPEVRVIRFLMEQNLKGRAVL